MNSTETKTELPISKVREAVELLIHNNFGPTVGPVGGTCLVVRSQDYYALEHYLRAEWTDDTLRYTPDLNSNQLPLVFFETKGLHRFREKGILKLRWAAREYPFFDFVLVEWDNSLSRWIETPISKK